MTQPVIVVDASVAIKWVVPEDDSHAADALLDSYRLIAPQLIYAECANILWKMARRSELSADEALKAGTFVEAFTISTASMRELFPVALETSIRIGHPAYGCFYLALAFLQECPMVTADSRLVRKLRARRDIWSEIVIDLSEVAAGRDPPNGWDAP